MTSLPERPNTALVVVDVQTGVVTGAHQRDEVVATIDALVGKARAGGTPVIWVQHNNDQLVEGTEPWKIVPELTQQDGDAVVQKRYGDSFEDTTLEAELAQRGVGRLVVAGAQSDACIRATIHGAFVRGYDTVLVGDAHTTEDLTEYGAPPPADVISFTNLYWQYQDGPDRVASVVEAAAVDFGT